MLVDWMAIACIVSWCSFEFPGGYAQSISNGLPTDRPLIIAHRGSSGMRPEHTVAAYQLAVEQGADVIECDVTVTKDAQLICTHDAVLNSTTNVASLPQFKDRLRTYRVLGQDITDYFTIDFTLEELKELRKVQSRSSRDQSYNGMFPIASFDDYIKVAKNISNPRTIGIYPETKVPQFFNSFLRQNGTTMEDLLLDSLTRHGYVDQSSPCFLQSFSEASLRYMANLTDLPLVFLTQLTLPDDKLAELGEFCYGLGPPKSLIVEVDSKSRRIVAVTDYVARAHSHGLKVHPFTFRNDDSSMAWDYGTDPYREYEKFIEIGVDGLFTDFPWSLANYLQIKNSAQFTAPCNLLYFLLLITTLLVLC